ncbi:MAG: 30S ribosome-binding factor RbfA [Erysipelotrichaceae bacterium]|jgi:ribosome-binding factor A|nr:30S ribosome-binding factor RbfA [Erysipelotrichaceae bacterium]
MKTNRLEHLNILLAKHLSAILAKLNDKKVGFVCLNELSVSPDLQNATVYVSFLGAEQPEINLAALNSAGGHIRSELAQVMSTYRVPRLKFIIDDLFDKAQDIDNRIKS